MINIESHASEHEKSSPFYQKNKAVCENWEDFTQSYSGKIIGKCSAWALVLRANVEVDNVKWQFDVKKSTMTNPSIFISIFGIRDIHEFSTIEATDLKAFQMSFTIRKKKRMDFLSRKWISNYTEINEKLVLIKNGEIDDFLNSFIKKIKELDESHNFVSLNYDKSHNRLIMKFRNVLLDWSFVRHLLKVKSLSK